MSGRVRKLVFSFCLTVFFNFDLSALIPEQKIDSYNHQVWQTPEGLPHHDINAIVQSQDGYLWFGSRKGLARFNGAEFVTVARNSIEHRMNLIEDSGGTLWFTTDAGLHALDQGTIQTWKVPILQLNPFGYPICADRDGSIWVGGRGLVRWNGRSWIDYTDKIPMNREVRCILQDLSGTIWIGTLDGVFTLGANGFEPPSVLAQSRLGPVLSMIETRDGSLWIGSDRGGLTRIKGSEMSPFGVDDGLSDASVSALFEDRMGTIWIGTYQGMHCWSNGRISKVGGVFANRFIFAIHEDREGSLWIGTNDGVHRLRDKLFKAYDVEDGLGSESITCIFGDHRGALWLGSWARGFYQFVDGGFVQHYTPTRPTRRNFVAALCEDADGNLWVGGEERIDVFRNGGLVRSFTREDGLLGQSVTALAAGGSSVWIATDKGLSVFHGGELQRDATVGDASINCMYRQRDGTLVLGLASQGLVIRPNGAEEWRRLGRADGLPNDTVHALSEDATGKLWIGTSAGLGCLVEERLRHYTRQHGLLEDEVTSVIADDLNLWIGSSRGLSRVSLKQLLEVDQGKATSVTAVAYGRADGLRSTVFGSKSWRSADGQIWFPTKHGVVVMNPATSVNNPLPPPVVIERMEADAKPVSLHPVGASFDQVSLSAGRGRLMFHFAVLSFAAMEKVRMKYKLEGFDLDWIDPGAQRFAQYLSVPPGHYVFRVRACNNDGVWNDQGASLPLVVLPHFYQTFWFYLLSALPLTGLLYYVHRRRVMRLNRDMNTVLAERMRIARELHDILAQGFAGVGYQLEALDSYVPRSSSGARDHLATAIQMVRHSQEEVRRSLMDLRSQSLEKLSLPQAMHKLSDDLSSSGRLKVSCEILGVPRPLPAAVEANLWRIGQEALTNAGRHADAQTFSLRLLYRPDEVSLSASDDGKGFDVVQKLGVEPGGFGLKGMSERADQIGAKLEITSSDASGTIVQVTVRA